MNDWQSRTRVILGDAALEKLKNSRVAVFGLGGVGGHAAEALARAGIGYIDVIDSDTVTETNLNRQLYALHSTIGEYKTDIAEKRMKDINPDIKIKKHKVFFLEETKELFDFNSYDYVVDAIDTVSGKLVLLECCQSSGVSVISAMGAGNKKRADLFEITDIYKTSVCPLAKVMRNECRKRGIKPFKVVYSKEVSISETAGEANGKRQPGSLSYVPGVMGMIMAGEVISDLTI